MLPILPNPHNSLSPEQISTFAKKFVKERYLSDEICDELIQYANVNAVPAIKKHTFSNPMLLNHCFLPADHVIHGLMAEVVDEAVSFLNIDATYLEPYKVQHYETGSYFEKHIDNYHGLDYPDDRKLTILAQLSHPHSYEGGDVKINTKPMSRNRGTVTIFPSFYPHNVEPVLSGNRYALVCWAWGPYWK